MSHPHPHPEAAEQPTKPQRQPSANAVIVNLNERLNQKANDVRRLEDREVYLASLVSDLENELAGMQALTDQLRTETLILRRRLELPDVGAIEITDDEAASLSPEQVTEQP